MAAKKTKQSHPKKPAFKLKPWHYLMMVIIPLIIYGRVATFGYVMHDDDKMILENPML